MKEKQMLDQYEFKVEKQEFVPGRENPEKVFISVSFKYGGEKHFIEDLPFSPKQVATGSWERIVLKKIDRKISKIEEESKHEIPDLEEQEIVNSGPNTSEPGADYPDRPER